MDVPSPRIGIGRRCRSGLAPAAVRTGEHESLIAGPEAAFSIGRVQWPAVLGVLMAGAVAGWVAAPGQVGAVIGPVVTATGLAVAYSDVSQRRIPNRLMAAAALGVVVVATAVAVVDHRDPSVGVAAGACVAGVPLLILHLVNPRGLGFGDVRYGFVLGASLGVVDWTLGAWVVALAGPAAAVAAVLVRTWRQSMPFGVFLAGAGWLSLLVSRSLP